MNYDLTPIETVYKGYKFRSRLEARWAVFFEELGLDWSYEVEGFNLPSGARYLPDFFIKNHDNCYDYWYEIKPKGAKPCQRLRSSQIHYAKTHLIVCSTLLHLVTDSALFNLMVLQWKLLALFAQGAKR